MNDLKQSSGSIRKDNSQSDKLVKNLPRAAAAAILSSSVAAIALSLLFPEQDRELLIGAVMTVCAVITIIIGVLRFSRTLIAAIAIMCGVVGSALMVIPRESLTGGKSLLATLLAEEEFSSSAVFLPCICFCFFFCALVDFINRRFKLRCAAAVGIAVYFCFLLWNKLITYSVPMMLMLAYMLIVACQVFVPSKREEKRETWYVMVCLIAALLAMRIPYPHTRIPWEKLMPNVHSERMESLGDALGLEAVVMQEENSTGFDVNAESIGGWLDVTSEKQFVLSFSDGAFSDRLTGSLYNMYTGKGWQCTLPVRSTGYVSDSDLVSSTDAPDADKTKAQLEQEYNALAEQGYSAAYISNIKGTGITVFYPPYSVTFGSPYYDCPTMRDNSRLVFPQKPMKGYTAFFEEAPEVYPLSDEEREAYLSLPRELPERIKHFAHSTALGCETDAQKAEAIMNALTKYQYSTEVGEIPEESDLVDYFLFESRVGYCEYFASSMAVLARCEGIPSRLAIGYAVPANTGSAVNITSANAHAWAELYIEGKGWTVYDPISEEAQENALQEVETPDEETPSGDGAADFKRLLLYVYCAIAAAVVLFFVMRPFIRRIVRMAKLSRKYRDNACYPVIKKCDRLLWTLAACGQHRIASETANEFASRLGAQCEWLTPEAKTNVAKLLEQTGEALYSTASECPTSSGNKAARGVKRDFIRKNGLFRYIGGWWRAGTGRE